MNILGIDIGHASVDAVLMSRGFMGSAPVKAFHVERTSPTTSGAIQELLSLVNVPLGMVVVSIPRERIVTRNISLPFKDSAKIRKTYANVAESHLPFSLDESIVEYYVAASDQPANTQLVIFAILREDLEVYQRLADEIAAPERFLMIDSLAAVNAYIREGGDGDGVAIVDVGREGASLEVLRKGRLCFSRRLSIGGESFTQAITDEFKSERDRAEKLKRTVTDPKAQVAEEVMKRVDPALDSVTQRLSQEIKVSLLAARSAWPDLDVQRIYLLGGASQIRGLAAGLRTHLQMEVAPIPFQSLAKVPGVDPDNPPIGAYGLALYGLNIGEIKIDFLKRPRNFLRLYWKNLALVFGILLLYLGYTFIHYQNRQRTLQETLDSNEAVIDETLAKTAKVLGRKITRKNLDVIKEAARKHLDVLASDRSRPLGILNDLSHRIPIRSDFTIDKFELKNSRIEVHATSNTYKSIQEVEAVLKEYDDRIVVKDPQTTRDRSVTFTIVIPADVAADHEEDS